MLGSLKSPKRLFREKHFSLFVPEMIGYLNKAGKAFQGEKT
jgi:hypothetical protein